MKRAADSAISGVAKTTRFEDDQFNELTIVTQDESDEVMEQANQVVDHDMITLKSHPGIDHDMLALKADSSGLNTESGIIEVSSEMIEDGGEIIQTEIVEENSDFIETGVIQAGDDLLEGEVVDGMLDSDGLQAAPNFQNIIVQQMDISAPLITLRKLLESRLQCSLAGHEFWLQDTYKLDSTKNLVSQCVQGTGMVQINVEVKSQPGLNTRPRLNIVDVLKPADEVDTVEETVASVSPVAAAVPVATANPSTKVVIPFPEESENVTRWIVDQNFRREQERLKIPHDPSLWNNAHVQHWMQWAMKEFSLTGVDLSFFNKCSGKELCEIKHEEFVQYIPNDKGDLFWTHLELLRKCKFVAVIQPSTPHAITTITVSTSTPSAAKQKYCIHSAGKTRTFMLTGERGTSGNRTGNNGQIQLWQFLLELLTDKDCREIIQWVGDEGEFKLNNPEVVAQMWGARKNKPTMNYEKLSRALRYYYDGDMIAKVHGKRFVYKFVCNLRSLLGYSASELSALVTECAEKSYQRESIDSQAVRKIFTTM